MTKTKYLVVEYRYWTEDVPGRNPNDDWTRHEETGEKHLFGDKDKAEAKLKELRKIKWTESYIEEIKEQ